MRLVGFSIQNYRSITKAYRLRMGQWTVLIGPNNEGKSNIIKGLAAALEAVVNEQGRFVIRDPSGRLRSRVPRRSRNYDWARDFPMRLQERQPEGQSVFLLEFELDGPEVADFREEIGSQLNGTLPIQVSMGNDSVSFEVKKQGRGAKTLSKKSAPIARFISRRLEMEYIPTVRTADSARRIVDEMVDRALRGVEQEPEYQQALARIAELQEPVLAEISEAIQASLSEFLPEVRAVSVSMSDEARSTAFTRSCEIVVDDGTATQLQHKGDGVQSIAALSLMRHAAESGAVGRNLIVAIEEPESHLHPNAIHQLRGVLRDIADTRQIVMTTHNPLFVDRSDVRNNIVVSRNRAEPATSIRQIREVLGVRASDNLRNADVVLVVEGEDDAITVRSLLRAKSERLREALDEGTMTIESLLGAGNLSYRLSLLRDALCVTYALLDDDAAGHSSFDRARNDGFMTVAEVTFTTCPGQNDAELEDLLDISVYERVVLERYGVNLRVPRFRSSRKWSSRLRETFRQQGKPWNDQIEAEVKLAVAHAVESNADAALQVNRAAVIDALVEALERRIDAMLQTARPRGRAQAVA